LNALLELVQDNVLATATWVDWFEISLLTWVIYRGLLLLRGSRGFQVLTGIGLTVAFYALVSIAGMNTFTWILDNLLVYAVLVVIILFQDDIRTALARAGGSVFQSRSELSDAARLEEIVRASFALGQRRIGALIAIERKGSLGEWVEGAHVLNARVSTELLTAVFHPTSPIHDGAAILRGDVILAAAAFLPISLDKDLPKLYGTRHRAAIGLTLQTDALCVLVSEERGTVALVEDGKVTPVANANELRQLIQERLEVSGGQDDTK